LGKLNGYDLSGGKGIKNVVDEGDIPFSRKWEK
jgi:hypothetical protein